MVIHDMRNPTNSIEWAVKEVLQMLQIECMINTRNKLSVHMSKDAFLSNKTPTFLCNLSVIPILEPPSNPFSSPIHYVIDFSSHS